MARGREAGGAQAANGCWHGCRRAALGRAGRWGARGAGARGALGRGALGRAVASARARGASSAAGAWACGERAAQAWACLCMPGCAQLGQVGCFVHSDLVFDPD